MSRASIQVPVSTNLKQKVIKRAEDLGFSSIQDVIRVFLTGFAEKKYTVSIHKEKADDNIEYLTDKEYAVLEKRIKELEIAEKKGELYTAHSVEELMEQLDSDDE